MRTVSFLCRLVGFMMSWPRFNRLYPIFEWLWRRLSVICRCVHGWIARKLREGRARLAIGWPWGHRGRDEPESGLAPGDKRPESRYSADEEELEWERRGEAPVVEREAAVSDPEPTCEHPGSEGGDDVFDGEEYRVETSDELYSGYDSTWETEEHQETASKSPRRPAVSRHHKFSRFESAARDMQNYRQGYQSQIRPQRWMKPGNDNMPNLKFYLGQQPSVPDGVYIDEFHTEWFQDYNRLEYVHTFIQWLFPLEEPGMNCKATPLTKDEIKSFKANSTAKANLLKSYKLMLDFYGIELCDETTGEVRRASNWIHRANNLNSHTHNCLRITRILKCLGTLGYPHYQAPLVHFFLTETLVNGGLPSVKDSILNYFLFAVLNKKERRSLLRFAYLNYDPKDDFVWCPKKIQMMWSRAASGPQTNGNDGFESGSGGWR